MSENDDGMRNISAKSKNWRNQNEGSKDGGMAVSDDKMQRNGGMDTPALVLLCEYHLIKKVRDNEK